jgi:two-component system, OmpR family, phosphate regulon sensor histidine kinase PhoR
VSTAQAAPARWVRHDLPEAATRVLVGALERMREAGAGRVWVLLQMGTDRYELVASVADFSPERLTFVGRGPDEPQLLTSYQARALSPFRNPSHVHCWPLLYGLLLADDTEELPQEALDEVQLVVERLGFEQECHNLRKEAAPEESLDHGSREAELRSAGRRAESLHLWYRQAASTLASTQLSQALPSFAQRAARLLEVGFSAVLVFENRRLRLWGGDPLRAQLGPVFSPRRLGSLARLMLEQRLPYVSSLDPERLEKSQIFASLGLKSLIALPLVVDDRCLGGFLLGDEKTREFSTEEIELAKLMAHQIALFLENALLAHGSDVERVVSRAVLDSMADGVMTLDWEKRITSFNRAAEAITGWPAERAIGRTCEEVLRAQYICGDPKRRSGSCQEHCPLVQLLADEASMEKGITVEGSILSAEGESRYVSSTYSVVADRGDLMGAVVLFRDITEKKAIEQMKSDYAAALSHDLKTPLTAMKGYAVTLLRHGEKLDEETRQDALEVINSEIDRVTRMFDNLLHQARIEAGQQGRFIEPVPVQQIVKRVVSVHQLSSRRHTFSCSVPDNLVVRADRDHLEQILNNLVSNSVKYSPKGCAIHIEARADGRHAHIEVVDTGPGIPEDQLPYVFERFRRVQDRMSRKVSGSGLGLYITRMLVEGMEGEVGASSQFGSGSTFWFRLPLQRRFREER